MGFVQFIPSMLDYCHYTGKWFLLYFQMNNLIKWLKLQLFILEMLRNTNATIEWFYQLVQSIKYVEPKPILLNFLNRRLFGKQNQIEIVRMAVLSARDKAVPSETCSAASWKRRRTSEINYLMDCDWFACFGIRKWQDNWSYLYLNLVLVFAGFLWIC